MKKSLLALLCVFALLEAKAQNSSWVYDFGTAPATPYTSTNYSSAYLPAPLTGGGNAAVRASSTTEGPIELISSNLAGGTGAELKMTSGTTVSGAKFGLAPFTGTTVATFQCMINISSGTNGKFLLYFGNGSNFTSGSGISVPQTFAALRLSPTSTAVSLDWLSSATSPNYTTTGLSQTTINKNQAYKLKFFMNNGTSTTSYVTGSGTTPTTHNLPAGTFDIWIDDVKVLSNADPGTGLLPEGTSISGMNLLNVGAGSSAPVIYIDDISYSNFLIASPPPLPAIVTNTILNINYEDGTTSSGITGITATHASAADAAYMISPGATGNYGIAHKVTLGNPDYYSDQAYRSESDAVSVAQYRHLPGDERRYEFSVLLKDWEQWNSANPAYGDNIFQLKMSDGQVIPVRILTKRNSIVTRNYTEQNDLVADYRPYINQWIHFRIDVKWTLDNTGYLKIYTKLPDQSDYNLVLDRNNFVTFTGNVENGNVGYLKWGVYREAGTDANGNVITSDNVLTRIAYHDDIKIFELNNNSAPIQIWGNTFVGNVDFTSPVTIGNTTNPNIATDGNTTPNFYYGSSGGLNTAGIISGRVLLNGWTNKIATSDPATSFDPNQYFEFKLQPASGYEIDFSNLKFTARKGNTTDPGTYVMRSSVDGFTNDITAPQTFTGTAATLLTYDLSPLSNIKTPITFRLYWYGSNRISGTPLIGIDDFSFNGQVKPTFYLPVKSDIIKNTNAGVSTYAAQTNEFDITALNSCGSITYNYSLTGATTATDNGSLANKIFNKGVTIVTWTATDGCNSTTSTFTVTVKDEEKPVITTPIDVTVNNDPGQCGKTLTLTNPIVTDNCGMVNITNDAPALFPVGSTIVNWKAEDQSGNSSTATQTVKVTDSEAPTVTSTAQVSLCYDANGNYSIPLATATDNCTIKTIAYEITGTTTRNGNGLDASGTFNVGVSTITWIITDNAGNTKTSTTTVTINNAITASIADVYAVNPGGKANTIYLGYGPSSLTLTSLPVNGIAPYTYSWSNGATTQSATVNPSTTGAHNYTVTITDALGCYITIEKQITVIDVRCATDKITICHTSNKSLCIATNDVANHLAHGCYLGSCESTDNLNSTEFEKLANDFAIIVAPNPTKTVFQLNITGGDTTQTIHITVFDILGRKISTTKSDYGQTITLGSNLLPGIYLAEVTLGYNKRTVKLIKQ
ncbi:heparin lyase I family protein [Flavobacterium sp. JAS]|uniref:heparin lyase I family protein n=1 Tax=Flavobacterium sp. JAS TaxID=2897329 RepID=UPI001E62E398|nr:heparin lyase I family protein [Flavobacterium sp. JAS]MCD0470389.1 heparin lyase I family protein [Flavobacterium sp. JAS]